jgi:hypothetical protein
MNDKNPSPGNGPGLPDVTAHVVRDMILLALDATESPAMDERNRTEARGALAEALDVIEACYGA